MARTSSSRLAAVGFAVLLGGCATFSEDGGFSSVEQTAQERLGATPRWQRTDADRDEVAKLVTEKLAKPLSVDDAVQIALVNNPGLQGTYAELGIAEADRVQAGRLPNPRIFSLRTKYGEEVRKVEEAISIEILGILLMPLRSELEGRRFEMVQRQVAEEVLRVARDTRRAWFEAVSAEETARYMERVKESAEASVELSRRMAAAGNVPKLTLMREQAFYGEAVAQVARAKHAAIANRERLTRLMGLYGEQAKFRLPERLPDLPAAPSEPKDLEATAIAQRTDVLAARRYVDSTAEALGLTRATRFVNAFELGRARTKEGDEKFAYGWEWSLEIPLFDFGGAKVAKGEAIYMQAAQRLAETAVNARSEVREAYSAYRTAYDAARHYREEVVPLRKKISEEVLLRYNGMLVSVFELLADAREQVATVNAAIDALRDFWLAENNLQAALTGGGGGGFAMTATPSVAVPSAASPGH